MKKISLFAVALLALVCCGTEATAGGRLFKGRFARPVAYSCQSGASWACGSVTSTASTGCTGDYCPPAAAAELKAGINAAVQTAIDEVNAARARRGLPPFVHDPALSQAAAAAASYRASVRLFGHVTSGRGDFQFLPAGATASAAGCAAYPPSYGWMSCCTYESYRYAGAAYAVGSDGKRYMHLFVR